MKLALLFLTLAINSAHAGFAIKLAPTGPEETFKAPNGEIRKFQDVSNLKGTDYTPYFTRAAEFWNKIITGYAVPFKPGNEVDGITITYGTAFIDGKAGIMAGGNPRNGEFRKDPTTKRKYLFATEGRLLIDSADIRIMKARNILLPTIIHEMGHTLGFGTIWSENSLYVQGSGKYTGPAALAAYRSTFDPEAEFVPVDLSEDSGTADGHWAELPEIHDTKGQKLSYELMTGNADEDEKEFLSPITVQSFADLGYTVSDNPPDLAEFLSRKVE